MTRPALATLTELAIRNGFEAPRMRTGIIGGRLGYRLLGWLGERTRHKDWCSGANYRDCSKLEALFGPGIWSRLRGKVVIDLGCGIGAEAIEAAQHGRRQSSASTFDRRSRKPPARARPPPA